MLVSNWSLKLSSLSTLLARLISPSNRGIYSLALGDKYPIIHSALRVYLLSVVLYHLWSPALSDQLLSALTINFHSGFKRLIVVNMVNPDGQDPANAYQDVLILPDLLLPGIQRDPAYESLYLQCDEIGRQLTTALELELTPDDLPDSLRPVIRLFSATDSEGLCFIRRLIFQGRHPTLLFDPEDI